MGVCLHMLLRLAPTLFRRVEDKTVEKFALFGRKTLVIKFFGIAPMLLRSDHPRVLIGVIEDRALAVGLGERAAGMPERVVEKDGCACRRADLDRAGKEFGLF